MAGKRTYMGVPVTIPRVGFFEFTSCEGCQLQLVNNEGTLLGFLDLLEIVNFREIMSGGSGRYDIAFVEGSISCQEEVERLQEIRSRAGTLVAFGSCSCFGGVNQQRNRFSVSDWPLRQVYGKAAIPVTPLAKVLPLHEVVEVDVFIYGCPVRKEEVERIVCDLVLGKRVLHPQYPVCMECTANGNICLYEYQEICLGPITRAGCDAWCPGNGAGCQGCRGPAVAVEPGQLQQIVDERGLSPERFLDMLECFGGFEQWSKELRHNFPERDLSTGEETSCR
jgi:coenzyme F420-reducing hydrogenase gamma subunit